MFQIIEGIVKVIQQSVIGIADGKGLFFWLPKAEIKGSHPLIYDKWQTTRFAVSPEYKINWKPEKSWDEWEHTYTPTNIKPIPQPIPAEFAIEPSLQPQTTTFKYIPPQEQQIFTPTKYYPPQQPQYHYQQQELPTIPQKISPVIEEPQEKYTSHNQAILDTLRVMSNNIHKILQLFEKFMNPPQLQTADTLINTSSYNPHITTQDDIYREYGAPPDEDYDDLPSIL